MAALAHSAWLLTSCVTLGKPLISLSLDFLPCENGISSGHLTAWLCKSNRVIIEHSAWLQTAAQALGAVIALVGGSNLSLSSLESASNAFFFFFVILIDFYYLALQVLVMACQLLVAAWDLAP